ncbi:MAG: septum formation initiator family protein [Clostridia bacterium]|nr:septum formation initiator family protein [Clostridia bacterium]
MQKAAKKTTVKEKKMQKNDFMRVVICCVVVCGFIYTMISQQIRISAIRNETEACEREIAKQEQIYAELKEKAKDNSTDEFYEEKARDEGYVRSDETVFIVGN